MMRVVEGIRGWKEVEGRNETAWWQVSKYTLLPRATRQQHEETASQRGLTVERTKIIEAA